MCEFPEIKKKTKDPSEVMYSMKKMFRRMRMIDAIDPEEQPIAFAIILWAGVGIKTNEKLGI